MNAGLLVGLCSSSMAEYLRSGEGVGGWGGGGGAV